MEDQKDNIIPIDQSERLSKKDKMLDELREIIANMKNAEKANLVNEEQRHWWTNPDFLGGKIEV